MSDSSFTGDSSSPSLFRQRSWRAAWEWCVQQVLFLCAGLSIVTMAGIVFVLLNESVYSVLGDQAFFQEIPLWKFLTGTRWHWDSGEFGVWPLLTSTLQVALIGGLVSVPLGLCSAIYLSEYATPRTRRVIKPTLELLAGVPTVVYGYFALMFVTPYVLRPLFGLVGLEVGTFNGLAAGIVVGIMITPLVASLSEDAIRSVPQSLREAAYALGSTRFDVSVRVVVPAAFSGIVAACLLAISRAIGETMAVVIAGGQNTPGGGLAINPLREVFTMTSYIVNVSSSDVEAGSMEYKSLYAVGLTLFVITLLMNIVSQWVMRRFREAYQ
ncbi:MAG: phosphate ABC transporter permease subunit PstC [Planctomycetaceae bacterium]|nr:phosphate ABC transporter permease subunit PstC [Planctomycetaceae bacterium]